MNLISKNSPFYLLALRDFLEEQEQERADEREKSKKPQARAAKVVCIDIGREHAER